MPVAAYAHCMLDGPVPQDASVRAQRVAYDHVLCVLVAVDTATGEPARLFGCSLAPDSFKTAIQ